MLDGLISKLLNKGRGKLKTQYNFDSFKKILMSFWKLVTID
jgi:hypothetical protein